MNIQKNLTITRLQIAETTPYDINWCHIISLYFLLVRDSLYLDWNKNCLALHASALLSVEALMDIFVVTKLLLLMHKISTLETLNVQISCHLQKLLAKSEGSKTLANSKMFVTASKKVRVLKKMEQYNPEVLSVGTSCVRP